jgi:hypothetical protein
VNSDIQAQNLQNSEINNTDAIEAAAANFNNAGKTTITPNVPTTPGAPSNSPAAPSNLPPAPSNITYDG